jgi:hypothetical protein
MKRAIMALAIAALLQGGMALAQQSSATASTTQTTVDPNTGQTVQSKVTQGASADYNGPTATTERNKSAETVVANPDGTTMATKSSNAAANTTSVNPDGSVTQTEQQQHSTSTSAQPGQPGYVPPPPQ